MKSIFHVVARNDISQLEQLPATKEAIDQTDEDGRTALMHAAIDGNEQFVKLLLQKGANKDAQDKGGFSALHFAAQDYRVDVVRLLIQAGAKIDITALLSG
jgi:ankyrin repeat protein